MFKRLKYVKPFDVRVSEPSILRKMVESWLDTRISVAVQRSIEGNSVIQELTELDFVLNFMVDVCLIRQCDAKVYFIMLEELREVEE